MPPILNKVLIVEKTRDGPKEKTKAVPVIVCQCCYEIVQYKYPNYLNGPHEKKLTDLELFNKKHAENRPLKSLPPETVSDLLKKIAGICYEAL